MTCALFQELALKETQFVYGKSDLEPISWDCCIIVTTLIKDSSSEPNNTPSKTTQIVQTHTVTHYTVCAYM